MGSSIENLWFRCFALVDIATSVAITAPDITDELVERVVSLLPELPEGEFRLTAQCALLAARALIDWRTTSPSGERTLTDLLRTYSAESPRPSDASIEILGLLRSSEAVSQEVLATEISSLVTVGEEMTSKWGRTVRKTPPALPILLQ